MNKKIEEHINKQEGSRKTHFTLFLEYNDDVDKENSDKENNLFDDAATISLRVGKLYETIEKVNTSDIIGDYLIEPKIEYERYVLTNLRIRKDLSIKDKYDFGAIIYDTNHRIIPEEKFEEVEIRVYSDDEEKLCLSYFNKFLELFFIDKNDIKDYLEER